MVSYDDSIYLVLCCQKGDRRSLAELAELVQERLWGHLCKMTSDGDAAGDVLQEVLLTLICRIKQLRNAESFWPWIMAVARSKVQESFRSKSTRQKFEKELRLRSGVRQVDFQIQIEQREELRQIYLAGQELNRLYAEIFVLRCFGNLSYQEIADITGCGHKNVYVHFHRARKHLCKRFGSGMDEYF
jgi:RNA polymerase sigma-70 factor (ECF subfamily)